jgi:hypothetical protein
MSDEPQVPAAPNAPAKTEIGGMECFVYEAGPYAAVDADVAMERKKGGSSSSIRRELALWAGIRGADNLRWLLDELGADANRASFWHSQVAGALKSLLFALHARPYLGHPLLPLEEAIANANDVLDKQAPGARS